MFRQKYVHTCKYLRITIMHIRRNKHFLFSNNLLQTNVNTCASNMSILFACVYIYAHIHRHNKYKLLLKYAWKEALVRGT